MEKVLQFFKNIFLIFPSHICSTLKEGKTSSVYVRKRITKNKFNVVVVYYKNSSSEMTYSELVQEADTYEEAVRIAKKMCENENDAL